MNYIVLEFTNYLVFSEALTSATATTYFHTHGNL